jgi:hypothetical protein
VTQLRHQLGDGLPLNPDVTQPPFPVWMSLPAAWSLLDTNPGSWRRSADELIDTTFRGSKLPAAERKTFLGFFESLVADCQAAGACVSLISVGRREGGGAASAGIHLAFADDGVPASLGRVQDMVPRAGTRTELDTPLGPALLQRERMSMLIPGTGTLAALTSLQIFLPIPDTTWTAVLASASAYPELTDRLEHLLVEIARSVTVDLPGGEGPGGDGDPRAGPSDGEGDPGAGPSGGHGDPGARASAGDRLSGPLPSGPRIEDGFDGLVTRRIGPPDGHQEGRADG